MQSLKQKLRRSHEDEEHRNPLKMLSNTMASNVTDCLLAPPFPGDIALVSVTSASARNDHVTQRTATTERAPVDGKPRRRRSLSGTLQGRQTRQKDGQEASTAAPSEKTQHLIVLTQALVAVGPGVTVSSLRDAGGAGRVGGGVPLTASDQGSRGWGEGSRRAGWSWSLCEGDGSVAIAGCGRLKRMGLRAGQRRAVDSSRAVGWAHGVSWEVASSGGQGREPRRGGRGPGVPASVTNFRGPGFVFVQTHSIAGLRKLLSPPSSPLPHSGASEFGRGWGASRAPRVDVRLSLKRGLAKRTKAGVKAGARRLLIASAFFALYVAVYSISTVLLLEGRDGLGNVPRHALQVVRSLAKVVRRVLLVLVRLGQEELWGKDGGRNSGDATGAAPIRPAEGTADER